MTSPLLRQGYGSRPASLGSRAGDEEQFMRRPAAGAQQPFGQWPQQASVGMYAYSRAGGASPAMRSAVLPMPTGGSLGASSSAPRTPVAGPAIATPPAPGTAFVQEPVAWQEPIAQQEPVAAQFVQHEPVSRLHQAAPITSMSSASAAAEFERMDANGDGAISRGEFMFDRIDRNHDGVITREELEAAVGSGELPRGRDWQVSAGSLRSEASRLASTLQADRDARAREASLARRELDAIAAAQGGYEVQFPSRVLTDPEMNSRVGAATVQKLVGTTKSLLQGLEEALLLRAGFLAGVFHSWRCESILQKAGRRFQEEYARSQEEWGRRLTEEGARQQELRRQEEAQKSRHNEVVRMQMVRIAGRFFSGGGKALKKEAWRAWRGLMRLAVKNRKAMRQAEMALLQSTTSGTAQMIFHTWREEARRQKHLRQLELQARRSQEEIDKMQRRMQDELKKTATDGVAVVMKKFLINSSKATVRAAWRSWSQAARSSKASAKRSQYAQRVLCSMLGGVRSALLHAAYSGWRSLQLASAAEREELRRREALRAEHDARVLAAEGEARRRRDGAHKSVERMIRKWVLGNQKALVLGTFKEWRHMSALGKAARKHREAVCLSMLQTLEGNRRGLLHGTFLGWSHEAKREAHSRRHQQEADELRALAENERRSHARQLESRRDEAARRHDHAEAVLHHMISCWFKGDTKGLVKSAFYEWHKLYRETQLKEERHQSVAWALRLYLEGNKKAAVHSCFLSWQSLAKSQRQARTAEEEVENQRRHWEQARTLMLQQHSEELDGLKDDKERRREKAHAAVEMMLRQWAMGSVEGLLETIFADWHRLAQLHRQGRRVSRTVSSYCRRSTCRLGLYLWRVVAALQAQAGGDIEELQRRAEHLLNARKKVLAKYMCMMGGGTGTCFSAWKGLLTELHKEKLRLHMDASRSKREELVMHSLRGMGLKSRRSILMAAFKAWLRIWEQTVQELSEKMRRNESLVRLSEVLAKQASMDGKALLSLCFNSWYKESLRNLQQTCHAMKVKADEHGAYALQLEARAASLEEQLWLAYQEIDQITHTMQKELQTKEELASELRQAYAKVRMATTSPGPTARSRSTMKDDGQAQQVRRVLPQAPASLVGADQLGASRSFMEPVANFSAPALTTRSTSPQCDWDSAVARMRAEGIVRSEGPSI